jgi:predicted Zn-dependent peptidase
MEFKKKVLKNGLTVLFEKRDVPVTTVMLAVKYGAAYEKISEKGIAHFIEHLCFKGTEKRTVRQISEEVERVGGDLNAFTHEELTAYHVKLPSKHIDVAMDVLFDVFFNPVFPEEEVEKEANVICEEIKMYRDNPRMHVVDTIKTNLYEYPFGEFIGGTQEGVRGMSRKDLFSRHRQVYIPSNSVLCVVGNNSFDEVVKMAQSMSVNREGSAIKMPPIKKRTIINAEKRKGIEQTNIILGFHFPCAGDKGRYSAELFSSILGSGMSSRLFSEVREKRGLVYGIKTDLDMGRNYGYMIIWAGTDEAKKEEVLRICLEEFGKMKNLTEEELSAAKIQVIGNRHVETEGSSETATNLIMEEIVGDANNYYNYEEMINSVSLDDIRKLASVSKYASFSLGP